MIRAIGLIFCFALLSSAVYSQSFQLDFAKSINVNYVYDSYFDEAGNYYITGTYFDGDNFDVNGGLFNLATTDYYNGDVFVAKYDPSGNLLWAKGFRGPGAEYPRKIKTDASGNVYVSGKYYDIGYGGTLDFNYDSPGAVVVQNQGDYDGFIVMLNSVGEYQWNYVNNSTGYDDCSGFDFSSDGYVYHTGAYAGTIYIDQINSSGGLVDFQGLSGTDADDIGGDLTIDSDQLVVTGTFSGTIDLDAFNPGTTTFTSVFSTYDVFLSYYNLDFTYAGGARQIGGDGDDVVDESIARSGEVYLTGYFDGTLGHSNGSLFSNGLVDIFLMKFEAGPNLAWAYNIGGTGDDYPYEMDLNSTGSVYITGSMMNQVDFDPDPVDSYIISAYDASEDAFILKLASDGDFEKVQVLGYTGADFGDALAIDPRDRVQFVSYFPNYFYVDVDPTSGITYAPGDYSLIRYSEIPSISSFSPLLGEAGTTVTITGQNFSGVADNNVVYFGATRAQVTSATSTEIVAIVSEGATYAPVSVTVNGLTAYSHLSYTPIFLFYGDMGTSFSSEVEFASTQQSKRATVADMDGDGKPDVVVAAPLDFQHKVSVFRNVSNAGSFDVNSFEPRIDLDAANTPYAVATGDLDGDGLNEVVAASSADYYISIFPNNSSPGSVVMGSRVDVATPNFNTFVAIHDLDADGKPEIISSSRGGFVSVFKNQSTAGNFSFSQRQDLFTQGEAWGVAVSDFDGDDKPDIVATGSNGYLSYFRNIGSPGVIDAGTFASPYLEFVGGYSPIVSVSDLDANGKTDVVIGNYYGNHIIKVYENISTPGVLDFNPPVELSAANPWHVAIGDLNGDGRPDLVSGDTGGGKLVAYLNQSESGVIDVNSFAFAADIMTGGTPLSISVADMDGDARADLVVSDEGANIVSVFRNLNMVDEPADQPTGMVISELTGHSLRGQFTPAPSNPDGYIVIRNAGESSSGFEPQDGVAYPVGTTLTTADEVVVYSGSQPYFNASGLFQATGSETFTVYSFNGAYNAINYHTATPPLTHTVYQGSGTSQHNTFFHWAKRVGGSQEEWPGEIAVGNDGSIYLTGVFYNADTDFNPDPAATATLAKSTSGGDMFVAKYNSDGTFAWAINGRSSDGVQEVGEGIGVDDLGNVYVLGRFNYDITFYDTSLPGDRTVFSNGGDDIFIAKFDASGNFVWLTNFGSVGNDGETLRNGFEVDGSGNVYIAAEFQQTVNFDPFNARTSNGLLDIFVASYNTSGGLRWVNQIGGTGDDVSRDLALASTGEVIVAGQISSEEVTVQPNLTTLTSNGSTDIILVKYDNSGNQIFAGNMGGIYADYGEGVAVDDEGSMYVTGSFSNHADFDAGAGINYLVSATGTTDEPFLAKYDPNGALLWAKSFNGNTSAYGIRVEPDGLGGVYLWGISPGSTNADPNSGSYDVSSAGAWDDILYKFSSDGFLRWAGAIGGFGDDFAADLAVTPSHEIIVLGSFQQDAVVDPNNSLQTLTSAGGSDIFFAKFGAAESGFATVPSISGFSPASGIVGTLVTITGSNFDATPEGNVVYFGSTRAVVSQASDFELQVQVPPGATYQPITVTTRGLTAATASPFVVTYSSPGDMTTGSFDAEVTLAIPKPSRMAIADLNEDGISDFVITSGVNNTVRIMLNESSPGALTGSEFPNQWDLGTLANPNAVKTADIDGDGKMDIIVANAGGGTVSVFRNRGYADFAPRLDFVVGASPEDLAISDLDLDGKPDIVTANYSGGSVSILRNRSTPGSMTALSLESQVEIYLGGPLPKGVAIGYLTADNKPDIAVTNNPGNTVIVLQNVSAPGTIQSGSFTPWGTFSVSAGPVRIAVGDLDRDGRSDIVTGNSSDFSLLKNESGSNSYFGPYNFTVSGGCTSIAISDITGDGSPDIATAYTNIYKNVTPAGVLDGNAFVSQVSFSYANVREVESGDVDGDGKPDLIFLDPTLDQVIILRNNTQFATPTVQASGIQITNTAANTVDFNFTAGDGNKHMSVMKQGSAVVTTPLTDGTVYNAPSTENTFGLGSNLGDGTYVVALGEVDWTSVTTLALQPATQYHIAVFEYNDLAGYTGSTTADAKFLATLTGSNQASFYTLDTEPTGNPDFFTATSAGPGINLEFSAAAGKGADGYIILRAKDPDIPGLDGIVDGTQGSGVPANITRIYITDNTATSYADTGLEEAVTYHYLIVPYAWLDGVEATTNFFTNTPLTASQTTVALAAEPTQAPSNFSFYDVTNTGFTVSFTPSAEVPAPAGYIAIRNTGADPTIVPQDGTVYAVGALEGNEYVSFAAETASNPVVFQETALEPGTIYHYRIYSYNGSGAITNYLTGAYLPGQGNTASLDVAPSVQASNVLVAGRSTTTVDFSFTAGDGNKHMSVMKAGAPVDATPQDGQFYLAPQTENFFGTGSDLNGGGNSVVALGERTSTSVQTIGLTPGTEYHISVFDYNDTPGYTGSTTANAKFLTTQDGNSASFYTLQNEPFGNPPDFFASSVGTSVTLSFTAPDAVGASGYFILRTTDPDHASLDQITDGTMSFTFPASITEVARVTSSSATQFVDNNGLVAGVTYNYVIIPFAWVPGVEQSANFYTSGGLRETSVTPTSSAYEPTQAAGNFNSSDHNVSGFTVSFTSAPDNPSGYIAIRRAGADPAFEPQDSYVYGLGLEVQAGEFVAFVGNSSPDPITFVESGLAAEVTYHYRIYSYNGAAATINYLPSPYLQGTATTLSADAVDPVVTNNTVSVVQAGADVLIQANITDDVSGINTARVYYRSIDAGDEFISADLAASGSTYTHNISSSEIGELGLEYFFHVTDNAGNEYLDEFLATVRIAVVDDGALIPYAAFGDEVSNYRIIAVPLELNSKSASSVFVDDLGPYDDTKWRMFRYEGGSTSELSMTTPIETGNGYWLIVKDNPGTPIDSGPGRSPAVSTGSPFRIQLFAGWNQIGNPYNFDLDWNAVVAANSGISNFPSAVTVFKGTFTSAVELGKFEGAFVFADAPAQITIPVTNTLGGGRVADASRLRNPIDQPDWDVDLTVEHGKLRNQVSGIGMRAQASQDFDANDGMTPPRFHEFVELNHNKTLHGFNFSRDVVPAATAHIWDFSVESSLSDESLVTIYWDNSYFGNNEKSLTLWDVNLQLGIDMKEHTQYQFDKHASGNFKVFYGDPEFLRENTRVNSLIFHAIVPNPVRDEALLRFTLPTAGQVTVEVLDITGRKADVVLEGQLEQGYHEVVYRNSDYNNAGGVYIARIRAGAVSAQQRMVLKN